MKIKGSTNSFSPMKLPKTNNRSGTVLLAVLLALVVIAIGATTIYVIIKCSEMEPREIDENDVVFRVTTDPEVVREYGLNPDQTPSMNIVGQFAEPLPGSGPILCTIQRSTNLVDWEDWQQRSLDYYYQQVDIDDPDPPYPCAFYRLKFE